MGSINQFEMLVRMSQKFSSQNGETIISDLDTMNFYLANLLRDDSTYSYDAYWSLMIITHNFQKLLDPRYLENYQKRSFFHRKLRLYYENGGTREVTPYLNDLSSTEISILEDVVLSGKQRFVCRTFFYGYHGLPEQLKFFCELPDFYPNVSEEAKAKLYEKK